MTIRFSKGQTNAGFPNPAGPSQTDVGDRVAPPYPSSQLNPNSQGGHGLFSFRRDLPPFFRSKSRRLPNGNCPGTCSPHHLVELVRPFSHECLSFAARLQRTQDASKTLSARRWTKRAEKLQIRRTRDDNPDGETGIALTRPGPASIFKCQLPWEDRYEREVRGITRR